jgi:hypothetical protein
VADHAQLLIESPRCIAAPAVPLGEPVPAELRQLAVGVRVLGTGIPIAEVLGEVEGQPLGQDPALLHCPLLEAPCHPLGRSEDVRGVAPAPGLRLVERCSETDGDHGVLERDAVA